MLFRSVNQNFGYIYVTDYTHNTITDNDIFVKAITATFDSTDRDVVLFNEASSWVTNREYKENPEFGAIAEQWTVNDMIERVGQNNLYGFLRMFDPYAIKYREHNEHYVLSMDGKISLTYDSIRSLQPRVWLKQHLIDAFVKALSTFPDVAKGKTVIISPTDLNAISLIQEDKVFDIEKRQDNRENHNYATYACQSFIERINKANMVYMIVHDEVDHYFFVELNMVKAKMNCSFDLIIADSFYHETGRSWRKFFYMLQKAKVLLLLKEIRPHFAYTFSEGENVSLQNDSFECGVHCCRRLYSIMTKKRVVDTENIDQVIGTPVLFRLDIAKLVIEHAAYITLYASATGSYPFQFDEINEIPVTIQLKIAQFEINRQYQYPIEDELLALTSIPATQPRTDDSSVTESKNEICKTTESFVFSKEDDLKSQWSDSINSGDRFHNNKYGLDETTDDQKAIPVDSSAKKPPTDVDVKPTGITPRNLDDEESKKTKKRKILFLKEETKSYYDRLPQPKPMGKQERLFNKKPKKNIKNRIVIANEQNIHNKKVAQWDVPILSNYEKHKDLDLVENVKDSVNTGLSFKNWDLESVPSLSYKDLPRKP